VEVDDAVHLALGNTQGGTQLNGTLMVLPPASFNSFEHLARSNEVVLPGVPRSARLRRVLEVVEELPELPGQAR
jgi:hypothetical protein